VRDQPRLLILMLIISAGAVFGANLRFAMYRSFGNVYGLFIVNILGSFLFGLFSTYFNARPSTSGFWVPFVMIGALGSFTTFSSYAYLFLNEIQSKHILGVVQVGLLLNIFSLLAVWMGVYIASLGSR